MNKAFTLIELLVVIAIIGVLASIVLVSLSGAKDQAELAEAQSFARQVRTSLGLSLVGEWKFDDENDPTRDSSGYDNHGTLNNFNHTPASGWTDDGIFGKALVFDGTDDYVRTGESSLLSFGNGETFTLSTWIKCNNIIGSQKTIVIANKNGRRNYHIRLMDNGKVDLVYRESTNSNWVVFGTTDIVITEANWHHVYITHTFGNTTDSAIYIDSVSKSITAVPNDLAYTESVQFIDIGSLSGGEEFNGIIDEVQIYNEALSLAQIQQLYAQGAVKHNIVLK